MKQCTCKNKFFQKIIIIIITKRNNHKEKKGGRCQIILKERMMKYLQLS